MRNASTVGSLNAVPNLAPLAHQSSNSASLSTRSPHNVRLAFRPRERSGGVTTPELELWTNAQILTDASPYFATLLASDFAESTSKNGKRLRRSGGGRTSAHGVEQEEGAVFEDSDSEADTVFAASPAAKQDEQDETDFAYHDVPITGAAYTTYKAVVTWLLTSHIVFARLSSSYSTADTTFSLGTSTAARRGALASALASSPSLPLAASPKSVYRLADYLDIPALKSLALDSITRQLSPENAAAELFGDVCASYPAIKAAVLEYAVAHWKEVKASRGMANILERVKEGNLPNGAIMSVELLLRVG